MTTGYTFDETYLLHEEWGHPESPDRLRAILRLLESCGTLDSLTFVEPMPVDRALLEQVHPSQYIDLVHRVSSSGGGRLDPDTYLNGASWDAALLAAGGAVEIVQAVLSGQLDNGFALIRPPGHHAEHKRAMGFCLFNNIAVSARAALNGGLQRVLIVDFDVHHGNGTQDIFYDSSQVFFFSTHQYPFYPGTGAANEIGVQAGEGFTLNVPLPAGMGDDTYRTVFEELLLPAARRFEPELVLVSAGFDAHWRDPLAAMRLSVSGFAALMRTVRDLAGELCGGRLAVVLEGGYDLDALAHAVRACFGVLLGSQCIEDTLGPSPRHVRDLPKGLVSQLRIIHQL